MRLACVRKEAPAGLIVFWLYGEEISHSDISGITTKASCEVALIGEHHVHIEICISLCALLSFFSARAATCMRLKRTFTYIGTESLKISHPKRKFFLKKWDPTKAVLHATKCNGFLEVQNPACPVQKRLRTRLFPLNATARALNVFWISFDCELAFYLQKAGKKLYTI